MKSLSRAVALTGLDYVVQCDDRNVGSFETIAAFNLDSVAVGYADDCKRCNPNFTYRVAKAGG